MCGKLAFLNACKSDCICDAVATEELRSEVRLRSFAAHSINQRLYQGYLINFNQISCMQFSRYNLFRLIYSHKPMGLSGLEPPTSRLSGVRSNQLSYKPIFEILRFQWRWRDSNSRPPACKAGALPTELHPHLIWRPPALPHRLQCSTIGRLRLNRRVRDGNGCFPQAHRHQKYSVILDNSTVKHISLLLLP